VLKGGAGREFVKQVVADLAALCDELGQQLGIRVFLNPLNGFERRVGAGQTVRERLELARDGAVGSGEQVVDLVGEDAVGAAASAVGGTGASTLAAAVVDVMTGAGAADSGAVLVASDERMRLVAAGTLGRGPDDGGVAGLADRSDRPGGHHGLVASAAGASDQGPFVAGVAAVADRLAGADPLAGT
jgi:hypothetical protein